MKSELRTPNHDKAEAFTSSSKTKNKIKNNSESTPSDADASHKDLTSIFEQLAKGATLKDIKQVSDATLEATYTLAYRLFHAGDVGQAKELFRFLSFYDHFNIRFLIGLAASCQSEGSYDEAISVYSYIALMDSKDARAPYFAGICRMALGQLSEAKSGFVYAAELVKQTGKHPELGPKAANMLELVEARMAAASNKVQGEKIG